MIAYSDRLPSSKRADLVEAIPRPGDMAEQALTWESEDMGSGLQTPPSLPGSDRL